MAEKANNIPANASGIGNQEFWVSKAADVMAIPVASPEITKFPTMIICPLVLGVNQYSPTGILTDPDIVSIDITIKY